MDSLIRSWVRSLKARNMSEKTIRAYSESATQLAAHVLANSDARDAGELRRGHVEDFLADIASKAGRPRSRSASVRSSFFGWLLDEEEIDRSPMERMRPPIVPDEPVEVLSLDRVRRSPAATAAASPTVAIPRSSGCCSTPGCASTSCAP